jgi:hypothetical protein
MMLLSVGLVAGAFLLGGRALMHPVAAVEDYEVTIKLAPEQGTDLVGGTHKVEATITELQGRGRLELEFRITNGPNDGLTSTQCVPSCAITGVAGHVDVISWTYRSNGVPGTDSIIACLVEDGTQEGVCSNVVFETWVERRTGAFPAPVEAAAAKSAAQNRARAAAASTPTPGASVTAPNTGTGITINPPSTGDGGLLRSRSASSQGPLLAGATLALVLSSVAAVRLEASPARNHRRQR